MFCKEIDEIFEHEEDANSPLLANFDTDLTSLKDESEDARGYDGQRNTRRYCVQTYDPRKSRQPVKVNIIVARQVRQETGVPKRVVVETANNIRRTVAWGSCTPDLVEQSPMPCSSRSICENDPFMNEITSSSNDFGLDWGFEEPVDFLEHNEDSSMSCTLSSHTSSSRDDDLSLTGEYQKPSNMNPNFAIELKRFSIPVILKNKKPPEETESVEDKDAPRNIKAPKVARITKFACPVEHCSAVLSTRISLRKHAKVHAARIFSCELCGKSFAENTKLRRHMVVHGDKREFKCAVPGCGKAFRFNFSLNSHMKTHNGEKKNICSFCGFAFLHPYNLRIHIERKHKNSR